MSTRGRAGSAQRAEFASPGANYVSNDDAGWRTGSAPSQASYGAPPSAGGPPVAWNGVQQPTQPTPPPQFGGQQPWQQPSLSQPQWAPPGAPMQNSGAPHGHYPPAQPPPSLAHAGHVVATHAAPPPLAPTPTSGGSSGTPGGSSTPVAFWNPDTAGSQSARGWGPRQGAAVPTWNGSSTPSPSTALSTTGADVIAPGGSAPPQHWQGGAAPASALGPPPVYPVAAHAGAGAAPAATRFVPVEDGFVTTAGNRALGAKYGNETGKYGVATTAELRAAAATPSVGSGASSMQQQQLHGGVPLAGGPPPQAQWAQQQQQQQAPPPFVPQAAAAAPPYFYAPQHSQQQEPHQQQPNAWGAPQQSMQQQSQVATEMSRYPPAPAPFGR